MEIKKNISLAPYTIFKIGGKANFFAEVKSTDELIEALKWARQNGISFFTPHLLSAYKFSRKARPIKGAGFILGAGSNILVSDKGFDGLVIRMIGGELKVDGCQLTVGASVMMANAVNAASKAGLSGFEWAIGVPGTIGGSIRGNAGCFGGEMSQVVERVQVLEAKSQKPKAKSKVQNSKFFELSNTECGFSYRDSIFKKHPDWIILSAMLNLKKGDSAEIQKKIIECTKYRAKTQDIGAKCAGCIFKNVSLAPLEVSRLSAAVAMPAGQGGPLMGWRRKGINRERLFTKFPELKQFETKENIPAGFLIDKSGLKGKRIGGAYISPRHANYFINDGSAKAKDIITLISLAKEKVKKNYGILLEEEIQYVGF